MDNGADAVSVSNHGGNQLDSAASTISVLPSVVEAVADRGEVYLDGGVRSGQDILKAMAYGAKACLLGRAHLYGLAAAGEKGVTKALDIIRYELDVSAALTGLRDVRDASRDILVE
jgi:L-lactate dehydrogenase (cytochrome)